jgi:hypothetical protein
MTVKQDGADAPDNTPADTPVTTDTGGAPPADKNAETPAPAAKKTSILDGGDDDGDEGEDSAPAAKEGDKPADAPKDGKPQDWPDDWRERAVSAISDEKEREKSLNALRRLKSVPDLITKLRNQEAKLSERLTVGKFDPEWPDEKKAEWRTANGVPEKPEDYKLPEVKGLEFGDDDKPILESLFKELHEENTPQPIAERMLKWYGDYKSQVEEQIVNIDAQDTESVEDTLRTEWGNAEFKANTSLIKRLLNDTEVYPKGAAEALISARSTDGHRLINQPWYLKMLADQAINKYGETALIPTEEVNRNSTRKAEIEAVMKTDMERYYREKLDKEYGEILARESKTKR